MLVECIMIECICLQADTTSLNRMQCPEGNSKALALSWFLVLEPLSWEPFLMPPAWSPACG